jgi:hypothetical protein
MFSSAIGDRLLAITPPAGVRCLSVLFGYRLSAIGYHPMFSVAFMRNRAALVMLLVSPGFF